MSEMTIYRPSLLSRYNLTPFHSLKDLFSVMPLLYNTFCFIFIYLCLCYRCTFRCCQFYLPFISF